MADLSMGGIGGGLMSFKEEYESKIKLGPGGVVLFILLAVAFVLSLRWFFPLS